MDDKNKDIETQKERDLLNKVDKKNKLTKIIERKVKNKLKGKTEKSNWVFLNMFGLIGWGVGVPLALSIWAGVTLDKKYPVSFSWTLTGIIFGIVLGCLNAWHWLKKEEKLIEKDEKYEMKKAANSNKKKGKE